MGISLGMRLGKEPGTEAQPGNEAGEGTWDWGRNLGLRLNLGMRE